MVLCQLNGNEKENDDWIRRYAPVPESRDTLSAVQTVGFTCRDDGYE